MREGLSVWAVRELDEALDGSSWQSSTLYW
jgi:hypothetical protein